jgi:hypothetical protein
VSPCCCPLGRMAGGVLSCGHAQDHCHHCRGCARAPHAPADQGFELLSSFQLLRGSGLT